MISRAIMVIILLSLGACEDYRNARKKNAESEIKCASKGGMIVKSRYAIICAKPLELD